MQRREFITGVIGGVAAAGIPTVAIDGSEGQTGQAQSGAPEFYAWQHYILRSGTQQQRMAEFLQSAAIPALNRLGHQPIGAFEVVAGAITPSIVSYQLSERSF